MAACFVFLGGAQELIAWVANVARAYAPQPYDEGINLSGISLLLSSYRLENLEKPQPHKWTSQLRCCRCRMKEEQITWFMFPRSFDRTNCLVNVLVALSTSWSVCAVAQSQTWRRLAHRL